MGVDTVKRFRAWLLLATFVATLGSSELNLDHLNIIDTACGAVGLAAGQDRPQLGTASDDAAQHCAVCHFLRAVSGASAASVASLTLHDGIALHQAMTNRVPPVVELVIRPSRGPPTYTTSSVI